MKNNKILIIIVGESGVGKSTFCKAMDCGENWFVSSKLIEKELRRQGKEISHDTIHRLANKMYSEKPEWQVPKILEEIGKKDFLILDGPRRIKEVEILKEKNPATLIIRIKSNKENRLKRLGKRDNIKKNTFKRIEKDENSQTQLKKILAMASLTIENDGDLKQLQNKAREFKKFLASIKS